MISGSGNISVITEENDTSSVQNLALIKEVGGSTDCCGDTETAPTDPTDPTPEPSRHNDLEGLQGGDQQNRYHINLNTYGALMAATEASPENRYATVNDLNGNPNFVDPSPDNPFITISELAVQEEIDPTVPAYVKAITQANITAWNTVTSKENAGVANSLVTALRGGNTTDTFATLRTFVNNLQTQDGVLSGQISSIMTLLSSDNVNLDTIQEIVNFIEQNKDLINYILTNKVDKVTGKSLVLDTEITKLSTITEERMAAWDQEEPFSFDIISDVNGLVSVSSMGMKKLLITRDTRFSAIDALPGMYGRIVAVIDDEGGHLLTIAEGNEGTNPPNNTLARAETELNWFRTDTAVYWTSRILVGGIEQTVLPVFAIDDYNKTLEIFASYPDDQILMSTNGGPFLPYTGKISFQDIARPAGFWKAKIIAADRRLESKIQSSLPTHVGKYGFPLALPFTLTQ